MLWMRSGGLAWPSHRNMEWPFSSRNMPESVRRSSEQRSGAGRASLLTSMLCWEKKKKNRFIRFTTLSDKNVQTSADVGLNRLTVS